MVIFPIFLGSFNHSYEKAEYKASAYYLVCLTASFDYSHIGGHIALAGWASLCDVKSPNLFLFAEYIHILPNYYAFYYFKEVLRCYL